ncbi:hypothetical protein [Streptomyces formicae]|uniref:Integral membrane protein n=1 Tax=Streptomyces formicae TaxID=1616117 RepID=A0ABY3WVC9_9ACTN|nr:hypothetical protein [Streptomyces formicae]UNM15585.1 hypothetical protein J4032_32685 [Streptomyces formicae]
MHGHGYAPPQPGRPAGSTLVALRVVFICLTVLSCGFLGWVPMLRLAIVTRRVLHLALFCAVIVLNVGLFLYFGSAVPDDPDKELSDSAAAVVLIGILVQLVGVMAYYLYAEMRHYETLPVPPPFPAAPQQQMTGYGYPPVAQPPVPNPYAQPVRQPAPAPAPAPTPQPPRRIDQVRAELDELSDLLRKDHRADGGDR